MSRIDQTETIGLNMCHACKAEQREGDRFCRRCGASQSGSASSACTHQSQVRAISAAANSSSYATSPLATVSSHRQISGPLVTAIAAGVSVNTANLNGRLIRRIIAALIAIPIWLIIILLSPLDAYASAKAVTKVVPVGGGDALK